MLIWITQIITKIIRVSDTHCSYYDGQCCYNKLFLVQNKQDDVRKGSFHIAHLTDDLKSTHRHESFKAGVQEVHEVPIIRYLRNRPEANVPERHLTSV